MSRRPLAGGFRLLCETEAAIGAAPGPPLPLEPSGTRAAILKKCDAKTMLLRPFKNAIMQFYCVIFKDVG
jgi:hypothetical protein